MSFLDYYKILEIPHSASPDDVKRAYRKLARLYHPDSTGKVDPSKTFYDIQAAYETLADAEKRDEYDRRHGFADWQKEKVEAYENNQRSAERLQKKPSEFGYGNGQSSSRDSGSQKLKNAQATQASEPPKPPPSASTALSEVFNKLKSSVTNVLQKSTSTRNYDPEESDSTIDFLRGERVYLFTINALESILGAKRDLVLRDEGRSRAIRVKIPAGVRPGAILKINCPVKDGFREQTVRVRVNIEPHELFERNDLDIIVKIPITFGEAITGVEIEAPTLDGPILVRIPERWEESRKLRVSGKGVVDSATGEKGDLYIKPYIVLPQTTSADLLKAAEILNAHYTNPVRARIPKRFSD